MPATLTAVAATRRSLGGAYARVLLVHGRERRDAEPLRGDAREAGAREPVAARAEGGPRDEQVGPLGLEQLEQLGERVLLVLGEVIVAAGERCRDLDPLQLGGQAATRADGPVQPGRWCLGGLLSAEAGKELVEIVDGSHHVVAVSACWPVWFVAPR